MKRLQSEIASRAQDELKTDPLPKGWTWAPTDQVGAVQLGVQRTPAREAGTSPTPYLRAANVKTHGLDMTDVAQMDFSEAEREHYRLQKDDLLLAEGSGSPAQLGRSAIWNDELSLCCYQNSLIRFRSHAVLPQFAAAVFRYWFLSGVFASMSRGVGIQHLGKTRLASLQFPLPPASTQLKIVLELNRRLNLLRESQIDVRSALAHIDEQIPAILEAAATGSILGNGVGRIAADPEIESIPSNWTMVPVSEAGELKLGKPKVPEGKERRNLRPYLRVANVYEDYIDDHDVLRMSFPPPEDRIYELRYGDLLLNEGQSPELVGRAAMYRGRPPKVCFQGNLIRFRAKPEVSTEYVLLVFRHYLHAGRFKAIARWSTNIAHLGFSRFSRMRIPLPPLSEQERIVSAANARLSAAEQQRKASVSALENLRKAEVDTLRAAVTGSLVETGPDEESADQLLKRLGPPPKSKIGDAMRQHKKTKRDENMILPEVTAKQSLVEVLRRHGGKARAEVVFRMAGFNRDSVEEIEQFYLQLRKDLAKGIKVELDSRGALLTLRH